MARHTTQQPERAPERRPGDLTVGAGSRATVISWVHARLRDARGSMTVLTTGVLVVILMVIGVGTAITGIHLERNELQYAADSAALAASQAVDPSRIYEDGDVAAIHVGSARRAAQEHLRHYPLDSTRTEGLHIADVSVAADGTVRVALSARTNPPLAGWFTRGTGTSIPLTVDGEARAR